MQQRRIVKVFTVAQRRELKLELVDLSERIWPEFMAEDDIESWGALYSHFAEYQFAFVDESDQVVAGGHTVPFKWSGVVEELPETIEAVMQNALANRPDSAHSGAGLSSELNYLCAIAALIDESARGQGISRSILSEMKELARGDELVGVVVPVRPNFKARHPETSIEEYAGWRREDGQLYDPWLRTHERLGAERLGFIPRSLSGDRDRRRVAALDGHRVRSHGCVCGPWSTRSR